MWEPCYNRPIGKAHEEYGYCQAGTSGHVSQDNEIIIGTPGPYTWRGTVYTNSISFHIRDDKQWYAVPVEHHSPVDKYSYLGMSVTSARIIGNRMTYVSGAPRANGTGQVLLFTKHPKRLSAELQLQQRLHGEQFASSFGYSLTTLDANGDQLPDLVVGAPFYYSPKATHIGGAVYVYYNVRGKLNDKWDTLLLGNSESRFGFALANLNDLNKDGYEDLAVGAPYDSDGGAVYVYLGSATGLSQTPVQVIRASDLPSELPNRSPFKTFGYSLSGGIDLDENGYPDLLVGAYESDAVVLLRSRPIIDIETYVEGELDNIDPEATSCRYDPSSKLSCFRIDVCFRLKSSVRTKSELRILYRIEAETFEDQSKYYRIKFNSSIHSDSPNIVEKLMQIVASEADKKKCNSELIFLKVNKDKSDLQNPIRFQLTFKLRQPPIKMSKPNERLPDINRYPILNQIEAQKVFEAKFHKDCGDNDVCESDMRLATAVSLPKTPQQKYVLELEDRQFNVSVLLANLNEPAYDAKLYIEHGNVLNYVKMYSVRGETVDCLPKREFVECSLGNPYNKGESQFTISFSPSAHLDDESKIMLRVTANTWVHFFKLDQGICLIEFNRFWFQYVCGKQYESGCVGR